jgi:hypothetical protein
MKVTKQFSLHPTLTNVINEKVLSVLFLESSLVKQPISEEKKNIVSNKFQMMIKIIMIFLQKFSQEIHECAFHLNNHP